MSSETEYTQDDDLGRDAFQIPPAAADGTPPTPTITSRRPATTPAPDSPAQVVIVGPSAAGKTELISAAPEAFTAYRHPAILADLSYRGAETARLIRDRINRVGNRAPGVATASVMEYPFSVVLRRLGAGGAYYHADARSLLGMDVPGGATFAEGGVESLAGDYREFRNKVVERGKAADALAIVINSARELRDHTVANGLPELLGEMAVSCPVTLDQPPTPREGGKFFRRRDRKPLPPPTVRYADKLNVSRLLLIFNHADQISVGWRTEWRATRDPRGPLSPLAITRDWIRPKYVAKMALGDSVLRTLLAFLKPGARLAVAVSSATGFDRHTGDPFCATDGTLNLLRAPDAAAMLGRRVVWGVAEALLYASFGIVTPTICEIFSEADLNPNHFTWR